ncbi:MAG: ATP-binding protein [Calditrichaeota bacterium]|nr:MAG: ATP-binding protein [Calditrichota bacterium]
MVKEENLFQLKIPSQTDNLEIIREFVAKIASRMGFNEDDISKIELAVDEACTNVIKHAYRKNQKKAIDISLFLQPQKLTIVVADQGKGFDPRKLKTPEMSEYLAKMQVGGLGVYLMRTLMDEVEFKSRPGKGNEVRMVKYLTSNEKNKQAK